MTPRAPCLIVRYCWPFVVVEVDKTTAAWLLLAATSLLSNILVVVVVSGLLHLEDPQAADRGRGLEL